MHVEKLKRSQIALTLHFKERENQEQVNPNSRGKEIIKIRLEINKIQMKTTIERIYKT